MQLKDTALFRQQAYIDGAWVDADSGQTISVNNPATGETLGTVPKMGAAETRRAVDAAERALPAWRDLTAKERSQKLRRWFERNAVDLAYVSMLKHDAYVVTGCGNRRTVGQSSVDGGRIGPDRAGSGLRT